MSLPQTVPCAPRTRSPPCADTDAVRQTGWAGAIGPRWEGSRLIPRGPAFPSGPGHLGKACNVSCSRQPPAGEWPPTALGRQSLAGHRLPTCRIPQTGHSAQGLSEKFPRRRYPPCARQGSPFRSTRHSRPRPSSVLPVAGRAPGGLVSLPTAPWIGSRQPVAYWRNRSTQAGGCVHRRGGPVAASARAGAIRGGI